MRLPKKSALLLATALLPICASGAWAQDSASQDTAQSGTPAQDDDFHVDEPIVVTAPYVKQLDILAGTSALAGEALAEKTQGQIGDMLTSIPGVSASSFSPGASRPVLRGFQGNRVAVLTDGIGNIDASNTSADHAVTIDTLTAERVEVMRGPAVLLFGGSAVGGAVNVIDKRIPRNVPDEPVHIDALAGYGSASDEWSGGASADVRLTDRLVAHVDGSYRESDDMRIGGYLLSPQLRAETLALAGVEAGAGHQARANELTEIANWTGTLPNSSTKTWSIGTGLAFIDEGGNLGVSFNVYDTDYGIPGRPDSEEGPVSIGLRQYRVDMRGEVELGEGLFETLRLRTGYADYEHTEFEGTNVGTRFLSKAIETRAELVQSERGGWRGASGIQYLTRDFSAIGDEAFVPPSLSDKLGLFTLQEFTLGNIGLEASLRYDHAGIRAPSIAYDRSFNDISGALGLSYTAGPAKFGVNLSRTARAPSVEELLSNGPHVATQSFETGNAALASEKSWNGEIYARVDGDHVGASLTFYGNDFDNFIYENATGAEQDDLPVFVYTQRKARILGFEAEANARLASISGMDVVIDGVADYTHAEIDSVGPAPRIPPLRLLGGMELKGKAVDLRGEVEWTDAQNRIGAFETPTAGFTLVNATATIRPFADHNISLIASANNIFDVNARRAASFTKDFAPLTGRDIRLSARLSF